jgi:hypothetical protein
MGSQQPYSLNIFPLWKHAFILDDVRDSGVLSPNTKLVIEDVNLLTMNIFLLSLTFT